MQRLIAASFGLLLLSAAPARAQEERWDARLGDVSGDVTLLAADGSPEVSGGAGMPLEQGDRVVVAAGGFAEIALDASSLITVREGSDFTIEKTATSGSSFFLRAGSLLARIQKLGERRLSVRTPTAVAAVRGTEFGIEVDGDESHVGVFDEGKVEVTGQSGGAPVLLLSNQETMIAKGRAARHAVQLKRFMARRGQMRGQGRRLSAIKAKWKALPASRRREMRTLMMERMREKRQQFLEKRAVMKQRMGEKRKQDMGQNQQRRQENLRKMDERRKKIDRGGRSERR